MMSRYTELVAWRDSNGIPFPEQLDNAVDESVDLEEKQAEQGEAAQASTASERIHD